MKLQVQVKCERNSAHPNFLRTLDFNFHSPQSIPKDTLKILQERLTREFDKNPINSPIEGVSTKVLKSVYYEDGQKNFFNNNEERSEQIHSIHNQLVEMLGAGNTYQAVLTEDRRPEKGWVKKIDSPHEKDESAKINIESIPERPTYLFKKPIRVEITAGFLFIKGKRYRMLNWDPQVEKITGGWVEDPRADIKMTFDRNYYCAVLQNNQRILVYETPDKEFYLHGHYG